MNKDLDLLTRQRAVGGLLFILMAQAACGPLPFIELPVSAPSEVGSTASNQSAGPSSAESDGFRAEATSPISVQLSWTTVDGATGYQIEASAGGDFFLLASLDADVLAYEVVPMTDATQATFRLTASLANGATSVREVSVSTPIEEPNPLTVQITLEETQPVVTGFDPSTFDPSTFDPDSFDPESFDPANLVPRANTVRQEIGPDGGSLEVTDTNGVTYRLLLPEGALSYEIQVSMTPISSISGMPDGVELLAAVQIEPTGFELDAPASLTIFWPQDVAIPGDQMAIGIGLESTGDDFHFMLMDDGSSLGAVPAGRLASRLARPQAVGPGGLTASQLQSYGAAQANPSSVVNHARSRPTADRGRATQQRAAAAEAAGRVASQTATGDELFPLVPPFEQWLAEEIIKHASDGSFDGLSESLANSEVLLEQWGDQLSEELKEAMWQAVVKSLYERLKKAVDAACMTDEHLYGVQFARRLTRGGSAYNRELLRRFSAAYGSQASELIRKAGELEERCRLSFELGSGVEYKNLNDVTESTRVRANFDLEWRGGRRGSRPYLRGSGPLKYDLAETFIDGCRAEPDTTSGSIFNVLSLRPVFDASQLLQDFLMDRYRVTGRMDAFIIKSPAREPCVAGRAGGIAGGDLWWTNYGLQMLLRGFTISEWSLTNNEGGAVIASRLVEHSGSTIDLGTLSGSTRFRIINETPQ